MSFTLQWWEWIAVVVAANLTGEALVWLVKRSRR